MAAAPAARRGRHQAQRRAARSIRSSRCARPSAISARHAAGRQRRDAAGAPARVRRPASISAASRRRARMDASSRATWRPRSARSRARAPAAVARGPSASEVMALYRDVPFEEVPLDGMRKTIAARLVQAKQTIPHFYLTADVEIGRLLALREEANAAAPKGKDGHARPIGSRSTISSSRCGRRRCSGCRRPTRCGRKTASCASSIPTSASRSRSKAG